MNFLKIHVKTSDVMSLIFRNCQKKGNQGTIVVRFKKHKNSYCCLACSFMIRC